MNTAGTKTIETERLILRRFVIEDAEDMYKNWASDPKVNTFMTWPMHTDISVSKALLENWISRYEDGRTYNWGITLKGNDHVIGNISVVDKNERTCTYELGYCLGSTFWGRGIMPEALKAVICYLFENEKDLNRIIATHDIRNKKSGRAMQKAGMHFDGILRDSKKNNLGFHDTAYYSILRSDMVTHEQYAKLFNDMHPGFFERDYIQRVPEDEPASEMLLRLQSFDEKIYDKKFPENISFGYYDGELKELQEAVNAVLPHWVPFFDGKSRVYCGFENEKIVSFCMIEDFGVHTVNGMSRKIGGPGCVGTLPEYRGRGIGLTMVRNVTKILQDKFYDYSYIHYTYETNWYSKLGYKTFLKWNGKGIIGEKNE